MARSGRPIESKGNCLMALLPSGSSIVGGDHPAPTIGGAGWHHLTKTLWPKSLVFRDDAGTEGVAGATGGFPWQGSEQTVARLLPQANGETDLVSEGGGQWRADVSRDWDSASLQRLYA
jgi:hypothetical protein